METGKRLFITGIPTSGKSSLAERIAREVGGIPVLLDDLRESLASDPRYEKWINFYFDQDEESYLLKTDPDTMWQNLIAQSEALWPEFIRRIQEYGQEKRPVIFESVNLLPHLAKRGIAFQGICLLGSSYEETFKRNKENPRWGQTEHLQELEAKIFFNVDRPRYKSESEKYGYPTFESSDDAFVYAVKLLK